MKLTREQFRELNTRLLWQFPETALLSRGVRETFGENLNVVAGGANLAEVVYNLIVWAEARGYVYLFERLLLWVPDGSLPDTTPPPRDAAEIRAWWAATFPPAAPAIPASPELLPRATLGAPVPAAPRPLFTYPDPKVRTSPPPPPARRRPERAPTPEEVAEALLAAFSSRNELMRMTRNGMGVNLDHIASDGGMRGQVAQLCQWAEDQDRMGDLIRAARKANPGNEKLRAVAAWWEVPHA